MSRSVTVLVTSMNWRWCCSPAAELPSFSGVAPLFITHLTLRQNGIKCRGMVAVSQALRWMKCLQLLDVSGNSIGCVGWNSLREPLAALKHLSQLDISGNLIHHNDSVQCAGHVSPEAVHPDVEEEASGATWILYCCAL
jgi:Ran GTPase-activating protein (RanGAP) involved in mRNA processing and transport